MGEAVRNLLRRTSSRHRPWQIGLALSLGCVCGLFPKANLAFGLLALVCWCLPVHLPLGLSACVVVSCLSALLCGGLPESGLPALVGKIGWWSLTHPQLGPLWRQIDNWPGIPWLGLNNTLIHGSLWVAAASSVPLYWICLPLARRLAPQPLSPESQDADFQQVAKPSVAAVTIASAASQLPPVAWEQSSPSATWQAESEPEWSTAAAAADLPSDERTQLNLLRPEEADDVRPESNEKFSVKMPSQRDEATLEQLEAILETCRSTNQQPQSSTEVLERASRMAALVDDLLGDDLQDASPRLPATARGDGPLSSQGNPLPHLPAARTRPHRPSPSAPPTSQQAAGSTPSGLAGASGSQGLSGQRPGKVSKQHEGHSARVQAKPPSGQATPGAASRGESAASQPTSNSAPPSPAQSARKVVDAQCEETLRHLLHHLRAIQDKV